MAAFVTGAVMWLLIAQVGHASDTEQAKAELDAIRTALSVSVGAGGAFALWLAARRQRSTEIQIREHVRITSDEKDHRERLAIVTELDLTERRITDLYTKAVEQLGSEKAPVRLGGLYALERIANDNPSHRQTIVNVLCAYLRMPYRPPHWSRRGPVGLEPNEGDPPDEQARRAELEVRLTAQRILESHLKESATEVGAWGALDIDLREAVLVDLRLRGCSIGNAEFAHCRFVGATHIRETTFNSDVWFFEARFDSVANLSRNSFLKRAIFTATHFADRLIVRENSFKSGAYFSRVEFSGLASFDDSEFHGEVTFADSVVGVSVEAIEEMRSRRNSWPPVGIDFSGTLAFGSAGKFSRDWPSGWRSKPSSPGAEQLFFQSE